MPRCLIGLAVLASLLLPPSALSAQISISGISISGIDIYASDINRIRRAAKILRTARDVADAGTIVANGGSTRKRAQSAVATGRKYVGVPYVWGGSTPRGFDCSGFVQYVYKKNGVPLPRTSRQMAHAGQRVPASVSNLREGDLMLFRGRNGVINHVALYAGRNRILHSSSSAGGVGFDNLSSKRGQYFRSHLVAVRRVNGNGRSLMEALEKIYRDFPFEEFDAPDQAPRKW